MVTVEETKQERRQRRRKKEKNKIPQHGKGLARIYKDAVSKRAKDTETQKDKADLSTCLLSFLAARVGFEPATYRWFEFPTGCITLWLNFLSSKLSSLGNSPL